MRSLRRSLLASRRITFDSIRFRAGVPVNGWVRKNLLLRLVSPALFLAVAGFYLFTLVPSLSWGDGAKLQQEAITGESLTLAELKTVTFAPDPFPFARLGVAAWDHPLYVILGYTLVHLLPAVNSLWLVNLLSALFGAAAIAMLYKLCEAHTHSTIAALVAALSLAVSHTFWFHSTTPEVYALFAFLLLATVYFYDVYERIGRLTAMAGCLLAVGLGGANHLLAFLVLPAAVLYLVMFRGTWPSFRPRTRQLIGLGLVFLAGFAPYLIQVIRLLRTFTLEDMLGPAMGSLFLRRSAALSPVGVAQSLLTYLMFLALQFGPAGLLVGLYGLRTGGRHYSSLWRKTLALYVVYTLFGIVYRVTDQFAFFLGAHVWWAVAIAMGTARLLQVLPDQRRVWLLGVMGLSIVGMPLFYQALPGIARAAGLTDETFGIPQIGAGIRDGLNFYINPNKRGDDSAERFGRETLMELPPRAIVMAEWYTDTDEYFVLRYYTAVEGLRPDVTLEGWADDNPFAFDTGLVVSTIDAAIQDRPIFLASLAERYYAVSTLKARYCIVLEADLYRVYPTAEAARLAGHTLCLG